MKTNKLPSGITGFYDSNNQFVCTGSAMGRRSDHSAPQGTRFTVRRERLDSGGYDSGGAYWGTGSNLYFARSEDGEVDYWTRAADRSEALEIVAAKFPGACFARGKAKAPADTFPAAELFRQGSLARILPGDGLFGHCYARAGKAFRRNLAEPGDCAGDIPLLAGLAVAEAYLGRGAGWIPAIQSLGCRLADLPAFRALASVY